MIYGLMGLRTVRISGHDSRTVLGKPAEGGKSPVGKIMERKDWIQSTAGHEESGGKSGGPPPKAKYDLVTDSE